MSTRGFAKQRSGSQDTSLQKGHFIMETGANLVKLTELVKTGQNVGPVLNKRGSSRESFLANHIACASLKLSQHWCAKRAFVRFDWLSLVRSTRMPPCRLSDGRAGAYAMYEANLLTKWLFQPTTYSSVLIWLLPRAITPLIHGQLRPFWSCFEAQDPLCRTYLALFQPSSSDREISASKNRSSRNHFFQSF